MARARQLANCGHPLVARGGRCGSAGCIRKDIGQRRRGEASRPQAAVYAKYGNDYRSPAWREPNPGASRAQALLEKTIIKNGTDDASKRSSVLYEEIEKLADTIRQTPIEGSGALRAKTLVAIFDCWPLGASDNTFTFGDEASHWFLFDALLSATGLYGFFFSIEDRLGKAMA